MNIANYMSSASTSTTRSGNVFRLPEVNNSYNQKKGSEKNSIKNKLREMAYSPAKSKAHQGFSEKSIVDQAREYSNQLTQTRTSQANTANQVKQLRYKFKDIASQIRQSKNSTGAKKVVLAARREVLRLKRLRVTGEYDEDELASAINHAQSMERIAKKKARHLQEEEMVKIAEGATSSLEPDEKEKNEIEEDENFSKEKYEDYDDIAEEDAEEFVSEDADGVDIEAMEELYEESSQYDFQGELVSMLVDNQEMLNTDLEQLSEEMADMLKDSAVGELLEDAAPMVQREMSEDEFKAFKQNHRNKEEKMLIKADAEYLKDTFERYEQMKVDITV